MLEELRMSDRASCKCENVETPLASFCAPAEADLRYRGSLSHPETFQGKSRAPDCPMKGTMHGRKPSDDDPSHTIKVGLSGFDIFVDITPDRHRVASTSDRSAIK